MLYLRACGPVIGRSLKKPAPLTQSRLREFFSAYLHQDFRDEYGAATAAAQAFCKDASKEEIATVRLEWKVWRAQLENSSLAQLQAAVQKLGATWRPQSAEDLERVSKALAA